MFLNHFSFYLKSISTLLCFMPVLLITGPFLSDLAVVLTSIFFILYTLGSKNYKYFYSRPFIFFLFFYIYIILNSLFNNTNLDSLRISFSYLRFGIFFLAIWFVLDHDKKFIKNLFFILIISYSILIVDGFIQYIFGENLLGNKLYYPGPRVSSFFGDELILGSYLVRFYPLLLATMIYTYPKNKKILFFLSILLIASDILIFLSGERSAFFLFNLITLFMIILFSQFQKLRIYTILVSVLFIAILSFFNDASFKRVFNKTFEQMNYKVLPNNELINNKKYIFSKQHHSMYVTSLNIFKDNIFFGVGIKNFQNFCNKKKYAYNEYSCSTHPHNTYLQFLAEIGLFGFFFILVVFSYILIFSFKIVFNKYKKKIAKASDFQICIVSSFLITLWPFIPTGNFFNNWLSIVYFYPIGFFLYSLRKEN